MTQVLHETRGPVALVTLNRPERLNAWTRTMYAELVDAIQAANRSPEVGAIVITGAGRAFCAGADIKESFASPAWLEGAPGPISPDVDPESDTNWPTLLRGSRNAANGDRGDVLRTEARYLDLARRSPEHAAAVRAFVERRSA